MSTFCYQCQETAKGTGCVFSGVCGKTPEVASMQDLLLFIVRGVVVYNEALRKEGRSSAQADEFIFDTLFITITNANFDKWAIIEKIKKGLELKKDSGGQVAIESVPDKCAQYNDESEFEEKARTIGVLRTPNEDIRSLRELIHYDIKGMAAYIEHAYSLGHESPEIFALMQHTLAELARKDITVDELIAPTLTTGNYGVQAVAQPNIANTNHYGSPEISEVSIGVRNNPGILVSGHDLKDIEELLRQTESTGVGIYTHSEMLPAHYYPRLKQYKYLVGNYSNVWWKQKEEPESFSGPILLTTNRIVPPHPSATYKDQIYTTGATGLEGVIHIPGHRNGEPKDFSIIIEYAWRCQPPVAIENGTIVGGFAHTQVIALAGRMAEVVENGAIRKFFVITGYDGRMKSRSYYTEFAEKLPADTVILTVGCTKYRYNKPPLGGINGVPRILGTGQCNDSCSLAIITMKLQEVFRLKDISGLPVVYDIIWYEQKAAVVLLTLLVPGAEKIHLGPTLPAFLSLNVKQVLIDSFEIGGISTTDEGIVGFLA